MSESQSINEVTVSAVAKRALFIVLSGSIYASPESTDIVHHLHKGGAQWETVPEVDDSTDGCWEWLARGLASLWADDLIACSAERSLTHTDGNRVHLVIVNGPVAFT